MAQLIAFVLASWLGFRAPGDESDWATVSMVSKEDKNSSVATKQLVITHAFLFKCELNIALALLILVLIAPFPFVPLDMALRNSGSLHSFEKSDFIFVAISSVIKEGS